MKKHIFINKINIIILFNLLFIIVLCSAQQTWNFRNPSFEGIPRAGRVPKDWSNCNQNNDTSPADTEPAGQFEVTRAANDGLTYLGLITRADGSKERVGQKLNMALIAGKTYQISMYLYCSDEKRSATNASQMQRPYVKLSFTSPTFLRCWGGFSLCDNSEVLFESPLIQHRNWGKYTFTFKPTKAYNTIMFEANHNPKNSFENGNLMIDNLSAIELIEEK